MVGSFPNRDAAALLAERTKLLAAYAERERRVLNHMRDFLDCVRTRRQPIANAVVAHRSMSTCHVINISMLLKRNLKFDPVKEEFIDDAEANRLRSRATREPWQV